jgi:hypothetical protein
VTTAELTRTAAGRFTAPPTTQHELFALWAAATAEANMAYDTWRMTPGSHAYAAFAAAEDRASAAQDALAALAL